MNQTVTVSGTSYEVVRLHEISLRVDGELKKLQVRFHYRSQPSAGRIPGTSDVHHEQTDQTDDVQQFSSFLSKYEQDELYPLLTQLLEQIGDTPTPVRYKADLHHKQWVPDNIHLVKSGAVYKNVGPVIGPGASPEPAAPGHPEPTPAEAVEQPGAAASPATPQTPSLQQQDPAPPLSAQQAGDVSGLLEELQGRLLPLERLAETVADHQRALSELLAREPGAGEANWEELSRRIEQVKDELAETLARGDTGAQSEPTGPDTRDGLDHQEMLAMIDGKVEQVRTEFQQLLQEQLADLEGRLINSDQPGTPDAGAMDGMESALAGMADRQDALEMRLQEVAAVADGAAPAEGGQSPLDIATLQTEAEALLAKHQQRLLQSLEPLKEAVTELASQLPPEISGGLVQQFDSWAQSNALDEVSALQSRHEAPLQEINRLLQINALVHGDGARKRPANRARPTALALKMGQCLFKQHGSIPASLSQAFQTLSDAARLEWITPKPGDPFNSRLHEVKGQETASVPTNSVARLVLPGVLDQDNGSILEKAQITVAS